MIELEMDTSTTDTMHGSGEIECEFDVAKKMIEQLSHIFKESGFSHKICVDDETGENTVWYKHQYP